ncbi:hypothetical protein ABKN59_005329 [Abortiporus biennis]
MACVATLIGQSSIGHIWNKTNMAGSVKGLSTLFSVLSVSASLETLLLLAILVAHSNDFSFGLSTMFLLIHSPYSGSNLGYLDSRDLLSPLSSPDALLSGILGQRDDVPDQNCTETQTEEDDNNETIILEARDVFSPKITKPDAFTVWVINTTVTVTWDTCNAPDDVTNPQGKILLGHMDNGDDEDENLDIDHPLAEGFDIFQGSVDIVVPDVPQGNDYIIVLMGDSGNKSPPFTIN